MDVLFDEREADKEVIESLLKTNRTLWRELEESRVMLRLLQEQIKRSRPMAHKLLQDENGVLYLAKEVERVAVEEAQSLCEHLKSDLTLVENFLAKELNPQPTDQPAAQGDQSQGQATDQSQVANSNAQVDAPAAPADPNQPPAEDPNAQPAPVEQTAPAADPNAQPALALDANGNPLQPPAPDLNAQPQEQVMPPLQ